MGPLGPQGRRGSRGSPVSTLPFLCCDFHTDRPPPMVECGKCVLVLKDSFCDFTTKNGVFAINRVLVVVLVRLVRLVSPDLQSVAAASVNCCKSRKLTECFFLGS